MDAVDKPISELPPNMVEKPLDDTDRRFEDWRCLIGIASSICLLAVTVALIFILFGDLAGAIRSGVVAAIFWLIAWGVTQIQRVAILFGVVASPAVVVWVSLSMQSKVTLLDGIAIFVGCAAVTSLVMISAFRLIGSNVGEKALIALPSAQNSSWISSIQTVVGMHPVCLYLPSRLRRVATVGLFGICQLMVGLSVVAALVFVPFVLVNAARSFGSARELSFQVGEFIGSIFSPFLWLSILIGLAAALRYSARYFSRTSFESMIRKDARAPILFLRSFRDDQVRLNRPQRGLLARLVQLGEPRPILDHILLEEATLKGPVIAIGAPGSRPPFGAARAYVSEDDWKYVVSDLAQRAHKIIMALDETAGIEWEWNAMLRVNLSSKVLYLLPPRLTPPSDARKLVAKLRAASSVGVGLFGELEQFLNVIDRPCVGWYLDKSNGLAVYTTLRPNENSYRIAVRDYIRKN